MLERYTASLLSIEVRCETPCTVSSEGRSISHVPATEHRIFLPPGEHDLDLVFGKDLQSARHVKGGVGETVELEVERPPSPEPAPESSPTGPTSSSALQDELGSPRSKRAQLSPAWFVAGVAVTAGLAGAAAWSGSDVLAINDRYESDPTLARLDNGQSAELRTNLLIGATAAVGVTTVVLAVFTDWGRWKKSNQSARTPSISPWVGLEGNSVGVGGRF